MPPVARSGWLRSAARPYSTAQHIPRRQASRSRMVYATSENRTCRATSRCQPARSPVTTPPFGQSPVRYPCGSCYVYPWLADMTLLTVCIRFVRYVYAMVGVRARAIARYGWSTKPTLLIASTRDVAPSLRKIFLRWVFTVGSLMASSFAMSWLERARLTHSSTCHSRTVMFWGRETVPDPPCSRRRWGSSPGRGAWLTSVVCSWATLPMYRRTVIASCSASSASDRGPRPVALSASKAMCCCSHPRPARNFTRARTCVRRF
jgi:hypothetical protein